MVVCDRCEDKTTFKVIIPVKKFDRPSKNARVVIQAEMVLCDICIKDLLSQFGKFKYKFLREGDLPEDTV